MAIALVRLSSLPMGETVRVLRFLDKNNDRISIKNPIIREKLEKPECIITKPELEVLFILDKSLLKEYRKKRHEGQSFANRKQNYSQWTECLSKAVTVSIIIIFLRTARSCETCPFITAGNSAHQSIGRERSASPII